MSKQQGKSRQHQRKPTAVHGTRMQIKAFYNRAVAKAHAFGHWGIIAFIALSAVHEPTGMVDWGFLILAVTYALNELMA